MRFTEFLSMSMQLAVTTATNRIMINYKSELSEQDKDSVQAFSRTLRMMILQSKNTDVMRLMEKGIMLDGTKKALFSQLLRPSCHGLSC